jgi:hypothetical protein
MLAFSWHGSPQADPKAAVSDNNPTAYSTLRRMVNSSPFVTTGFDGPFRQLPQRSDSVAIGGTTDIPGARPKRHF